jgi:hypothetical protein
VTNNIFDENTYYDYITTKYYPDGDTAWVRVYKGAGNYLNDFAEAIAADGIGNVYVTGKSEVLHEYYNFDYATIKYDLQGNAIWERIYNGPGNNEDNSQAIAVNGSGDIYVTGDSWGNLTSRDYATIKYYPDGDTAWMRRYNGPGNELDYAHALTIGSSGTVYVTGGSYGSGTDLDYATIKYVQFLRGDANKDGIVDIIDVVYLVNYVLKSGSAPVPIPQVGDVNCDGKVDIIDAVYLVNYLFRSGTPPCQ